MTKEVDSATFGLEGGECMCLRHVNTDSTINMIYWVTPSYRWLAGKLSLWTV